MGEELSAAGVANRVVAQPGQIIKGVPPFFFVMPEGWILDEAPGTLCALRLSQEVDGFWVNALLTHDKVARAVDFKAAAQITWRKLQRSGVRDLVERGEKLMRFGKLPMYVRGCEFKPKDDDRVLAQMHVIFFAPVDEGGKVVDLFQLVLTAPATVMEKVAPDILELISTFRFT